MHAADSLCCAHPAAWGDPVLHTAEVPPSPQAAPTTPQAVPIEAPGDTIETPGGPIEAPRGPIAAPRGPMQAPRVLMSGIDGFTRVLGGSAAGGLRWSAVRGALLFGR